MANKNASKGTRFERLVRDYLIGKGWWVMRSPASKSVVDLVALPAVPMGRDPILVQCKTNGRLDPDEWNELLETAQLHGATAICADRPSRGIVRFRELLHFKKGDEAQPWRVIPL